MNQTGVPKNKAKKGKFPNNLRGLTHYDWLNNLCKHEKINFIGKLYVSETVILEYPSTIILLFLCHNLSQGGRLTQSASLERDLACLGILGNIGSETDGRTTLSRGILTTRRNVIDILQQLRLWSARVTTEENIDLRSKVPSTLRGEVLPCPTKKLENRWENSPGSTSNLKIFRRSQISIPSEFLD